MTEEQIYEGDRLMCVFMGGHVEEDDVWLGQDSNSYTGELEYSTNWSWLMPIVEKIELTNIVQIWPYECLIHRYNGTINMNNKIIIWTTGDTKIEAVYEAVVEFIKWHNAGRPDDWQFSS